MYVKDRMNKKVVFVSENLSVAKALAAMNESNHKRLPVVDAQNKPIGVIDRRSIDALGTARFVLANTKITDIMDSGLFKVSEEMLVEDCALVMKDNKTGFLPVVDKNGILTGVITSYDMFKGLMKLMDIKGEGCRCIVEGREIGKITEVLSDCDIRSIYTDEENTVVKFDTNDFENAKKKLEEQFNVLYIKNRF